MKSLLSFAVVALSLVSALPASADSPLTSTDVSSKTAAHVGSAPYTGHDATPKEAKQTVAAGLAAIKASHASPTVGLAVIQRVDSATMSNPQAQAAFKQGLTNLARHTSDPTVKANIGLLRGTFTIMRKPDDAYAAREVNHAVSAQPNDARVQLVGGLASAQRAAFGPTSSWDKPTQLWKQSAARLQTAGGAGHSSPLVKEGLANGRSYLSSYEAFQKAEQAPATPPSSTSSVAQGTAGKIIAMTPGSEGAAKPAATQPAAKPAAH